VELTVEPAREADRPVVRRLLELYRYDFSEFDGGDVDPHGEYGYRYLDHYWTEPVRHAFLFRVDGHWAGFALVRVWEPNDMAEFFVMRKYRRHGFGRRAAETLFARFPGRWTVRQQRSNPQATSFWRSVIPMEFEERVTSDEIIQAFVVPT
jgi:predicted acetyltransferase